MENPSWLKPYLNKDDIKHIEQAVADIETMTSGEVVPMIVHRSSHIGHIPLFIYSLGLLLYFVFGLQELLMEHFVETWWGVLVWAAVWLPITLVLSRSALIQRLCVSSIDRNSQTWQRAEVEFHRAGLNKTDGSTGILLFVSLVEHKAVVLGDKAIAQKFDKDDWQEVVTILVQGIRTKNMKKGFIDAIQKCGEPLKEHFPIQPDDINELPNTLIIKE